MGGDRDRGGVFGPFFLITARFYLGGLVLFVALLPLLVGNYWTQILGNIGIYIMLGVGLNVVVGFAGLLDRSPERSFLVHEAYFQHEKNRWIDAQIFGKKRRDPAVSDAISDLKALLKKQLNEFIRAFDIHLLVAENILTIPMHIPLGIALTEIIAETQIPTIAHHHDFYW